MKIEHYMLHGHPVTVLRVKQWHACYRLFNILFARASRSFMGREYMIVDEGVTIHWSRP